MQTFVGFFVILLEKENKRNCLKRENKIKCDLSVGCKKNQKYLSILQRKLHLKVLATWCIINFALRNDRAGTFISKGEFLHQDRCLGLIWHFWIWVNDFETWIWVNDFWEKWGKILGLKCPGRWAKQLNYEMKEKSMEVYCKKNEMKKVKRV